MGDNMEVSYREITEITELQAAVELQKTAWSQETITSMPQMAAAILHGGIVIGAFAGPTLIGFNYGFAGFDGREAFLGSHMMAIHHDHRDRGIGMKLKLEQRLCAIRLGYRRIVWTYDPFEPRNAYLNICKLGGTVGRYIPSFYGLDQLGLPTDRFLVEWDISANRVEEALLSPKKIYNYPSLLAYERKEDTITQIDYSENLLLSGSNKGYLIPIPKQVQELKREQANLVLTWQSYLRSLCTEAFSLNYQVVSFIRSDELVDYYVLEVKQ